MKRTLFLVPVLLLASVIPPARAEDCRSMMVETAPFGGGARVEPIEVEDVKVNVLLPPSYAESSRRYPVLYLLHGFSMNQDSWLVYSDVEAFTAGLPEEQQAIVVMPAGNGFAFDVDHRNGTELFETFYLERLIPAIDARYRTIADREHRGIAGLSGGAVTAMMIAGRNPHAFGSVGGFSGTYDVTWGADAAGMLVTFGVERAVWACFEGQPGDEGVWGDPVRDPMWYHAHNPVDLARNYRGMAVYFFTGTSVPCDARDAEDLASPPTRPATGWQTAEAVLRPGSETFHRALERERIPHTADLPLCGIHSWRYFQKGLHDFWPIMVDAWDEPAPATFDYRTSDTPESRRTSSGMQLHSTHEAWGWTFLADPARAPEFLDVRDASCNGFTITGSGTATATTAPCFTPGATVRAGDVQYPVDDEGRITLPVDLGPPHEHQQYTAQARAAETSTPGYWTTRTIAFEVVA